MSYGSHGQDLAANLTRWLDYRQKADEYTKKVEKYRQLVEQGMIDASVTQTRAQTSDGKIYKVSLSNRSRESLSKKDVPSDVWEQYAKASRFRVLLAQEEKKSDE